MEVTRRLACLLLLAAPLILASSAEYQEALRRYQRTDYQGSLEILRRLPAKDAAAWELIGKNEFMSGEFKRASEAFEKALSRAPAHSPYAHWLGKAYGRRAESANPFSAPSLASKARRYFERAVELDPRNLEALSDLLEYYLEAPGFLGGGTDKAIRVVEQIQALDAVEGANARARLAEKRKEYSNAEAQLRRAVELAPKKINRLLDLAGHLARRGRFPESEQLYQQAASIDPRHPRLLFERAEAYVRAGQKLDAAREMLRQYLESPLTPDDPPRQAAEKLLKQVGG